MDPITHGIVGGAVAAALGVDVSLTNPLFLATTLGAVIPDLDIIYQYWGDYVYLKNHRGFSHSFLGLLAMSPFLGAIIHCLFPHYSIAALSLWVFIGALSHSFLDLLNSYGVMLFSPFSKKKYTLNLLMITDPILIITNLLIIYLALKESIFLYPTVGLAAGYLFFRLLMRRRAEKLIKAVYSSHRGKIVVMPAFIGLVKWDFIIRLNNKNIVGQINLLTSKIKIHKKLKLISEEITEKLEKTTIGKIFQEFTPFCHIACKMENDKLIGRFTDLRYFVRNRFLHHATVVVNPQDYQVEKAVFQPYTLNNKIEVD